MFLTKFIFESLSERTKFVSCVSIQNKENSTRQTSKNVKQTLYIVYFLQALQPKDKTVVLPHECSREPLLVHQGGCDCVPGGHAMALFHLQAQQGLGKDP